LILKIRVAVCFFLKRRRTLYTSLARRQRKKKDSEVMNIDPLEAACLAIQSNTAHAIKLVGGGSFNLYDQDVAVLADAWAAGNSSVTLLDLSLNKITDVGAKALAAALAANTVTNLQTLILDSNSISDEGAAAIVSALPPSTTRLDLSGNLLSDLTVSLILNLLQKNERCFLRTLELRDNPKITDMCWPGLAKYLTSASARIVTLVISGNAFTDHSIPFIEDVVRSSTSLVTLNVGNSKIRDYMSIAQAAITNRKLQSLILATDGRKFILPELETSLKANRKFAASPPELLALQKREHEEELARLRRRYEERIAALESQVNALQQRQ
jgi:Ran GTPase-activating protein (RanGAP) involved in mRNA processing and transport